MNKLTKTVETKSILSEWNNFLLNESTAARVKQMIDSLENFGSKITIKDKDDIITIMYHPTKKTLYGNINCRSSEKLGFSKATHSGIGAGEINSTWYVTLTTRTTDGMGPLLYETLIEYISSRKNAALKPDSASVSSEARAVWEKFDKRADIKKIQLDVDTETVDTIRRSGDNIEQTTPDNVKDDTEQFSAIYDKGDDDWSSSSLSRAYRKDDTSLIDELLSRNLITMPTPPRVFKSKLGGAW